VRDINASVSRSKYMLSTLAEATARTVPKSVTTMMLGGGRMGASQSPVAVVKATSAVMRGFVNET
jgi:hypothetical protein